MIKEAHKKKIMLLKDFRRLKIIKIGFFRYKTSFVFKYFNDRKRIAVGKDIVAIFYAKSF
jgi:hypothetical protein